MHYLAKTTVATCRSHGRDLGELACPREDCLPGLLDRKSVFFAVVVLVGFSGRHESSFEMGTLCFSYHDVQKTDDRRLRLISLHPGECPKRPSSSGDCTSVPNGCNRCDA